MLAVVHSDVLIYPYWRTHSHSSASIMWSRTDNSTQSALVNSQKVKSIVLVTSPPAGCSERRHGGGPCPPRGSWTRYTTRPGRGLLRLPGPTSAAPQRTGWPGHREPSTSSIAKTHVGRARMARSLAWTMVSDFGGLASVRAGRLGASLITAVLQQRDRDGTFNVVVHAIPGVWSGHHC